MSAAALIKQSVAPIGCRATSGDRAQVAHVLGTATFTSAAGAFITAGHVVLNVPNGCNGPAVFVPIGGWRAGATSVGFVNFGYKCHINDDLDVADCMTDRDVTSERSRRVTVSPVTFNDAVPGDGTLVALTGFPLGNHLPITTRGAVAAALAGPRTSGRAAHVPNFDLWMHLQSWPGMSGGPVYLSNGRVIGMMINGEQKDGVMIAAISTARPSFLIQKWMQR